MLTRRFNYIVEEGDTLFGIALKFNVPLQTLIKINNLQNQIQEKLIFTHSILSKNLCN